MKPKQSSESWQDILVETLTRHLDFLDQIRTYSRRIAKIIEEDSTKDINVEIENRRKVISISMTFQQKMLGFISENKNEIAKNENGIREIIELWERDVKIILDKVKSLDLKTMELLENRKLKTTKEIATVFNSKNRLKGYDLSNVK